MGLNDFTVASSEFIETLLQPPPPREWSVLTYDICQKIVRTSSSSSKSSFTFNKHVLSE
jgi:hypothetical protein